MSLPAHHVDHPSPEADPASVGWLRSLAWDGEDRLSYWLSACFGADASPRTRLIARRLLIAGVARTVDPGAEIGWLPVFGQIGDDEARVRSAAALHVLCDEVGVIEGHAVLRVQSLQGLGFRLNAHVNHLLESVVEVARGGVDADAYVGRDWVPVVVFGGAVLTGGVRNHRRLLVVDLADGDAAKLRGWRDQLWAQAVHVHRTGETWLNAEGL